MTSDAKTRLAKLKSKVELTDDGIRTARVHVSGMSVITSVVGNKPFAGDNTVVTQDAFDQSQVLATAEEFLARIEKHGIDLKSVYGKKPLRFLVNQTSEGNADYAPGSQLYVFGTNEGGFHLASCKDIILHELGHGFVDHVAPGLTADENGEGATFHEAMGDLFAGLYFGNPHISEDFATFLAGKKKSSKDEVRALRDLKNDAVLSAKTKQEHKRSLVYSGMVWAAAEALVDKLGEKAYDKMFGVLTKVPFVLTSKSPTPLDVARAFANAARAALTGADADLVVSVLEAQARERKIISAKDSLSSEADTEPAKQLRAKVKTPKSSKTLGLLPASTFADAVATLAPFAERPDVRLEVLKDRYAGSLRRITLRCVAKDPTTHANVPVEDGLLDVVIDRRGVYSISGGALTLPKQFIFAAKHADVSSDFEEAKAILARHFETTQTPAARAIHGAFATLFDRDNVQIERVLSGGSLCLEVRTMAGEMIVDLATGAVKIRRLLHVEGGL